MGPWIAFLLQGSFFVKNPSSSKIKAICHAGGKYLVLDLESLQAPSLYAIMTSLLVAASMRRPVCSSKKTLKTSSVSHDLFFPCSDTDRALSRIRSKASRIRAKSSLVSPLDVSGWYLNASRINAVLTVSSHEFRGTPNTFQGFSEDKEDLFICCWYCRRIEVGCGFDRAGTDTDSWRHAEENLIIFDAGRKNNYITPTG